MPSGGHATRFIDNMVSGDDLAAVLRGHLHVERAIEELLLEEMPGSEPLLEKLNFFSKARVARELGLIEKAHFKAIEALNRLRNQFAHNFTREGLTADDDTAMVAALEEPILSIFLDMKSRNTMEVKPGRDTRIAIGALWVSMRRLVAAKAGRASVF